MNDQHGDVIRGSGPIGSYSILAFTPALVAAALPLGWLILVGLSDRFDPRATGSIFVGAVVLAAVPLLRAASFDIRMTFEPIRGELVIERNAWWRRQRIALSRDRIERWYLIESLGCVVIDRSGDGRPIRLVLHTPQSSPRRRADAVPRAVAFLDGALRDLRDAEAEPAISRRARRRMILGVLTAVVALAPVVTLITLHLFG